MILKRRLAISLLFCSLAVTPIAGGQVPPNPGWHPSNAPFRVLAIAGEGSSLWVCGTDEGIAVSDDGGAQWQLKHQAQDGNLLLNIQFVNTKFGYAAGTGGLILTTEDGGETWSLIRDPTQLFSRSASPIQSTA